MAYNHKRKHKHKHGKVSKLNKVLMIVSAIFMTITLCSCVSQEEKEKANSIIEENTQIIEEFIRKELPGYNVSEINMKYKSDGFSLITTDFLEIQLEQESTEENGTEQKGTEQGAEQGTGEISILYNVSDKAIYSNHDSLEIKNSIISELESDCIDAEVGFRNNNIPDYIGVYDDYIHLGNIDKSNNLIKNNKSVLDGEYTLLFVLRTDDKGNLTDLYDYIDKFKNTDIKAKFIIGNSDTSSIFTQYILKKIEQPEEFINESGTEIIIERTDGKCKETIRESCRINLGDGWVMYNPLIYKLSIHESDKTVLGENNVDNSSNDYVAEIKTLNSNYTSKEFQVYSKKYTGVIYGCRDNFFTDTKDMTRTSLLSFSPTYYTSIKLDSMPGDHNVTFALYY